MAKWSRRHRLSNASVERGGIVVGIVVLVWLGGPQTHYARLLPPRLLGLLGFYVLVRRS